MIWLYEFYLELQGRALAPVVYIVVLAHSAHLRPTDTICLVCVHGTIRSSSRKLD